VRGRVPRSSHRGTYSIGEQFSSQQGQYAHVPWLMRVRVGVDKACGPPPVVAASVHRRNPGAVPAEPGLTIVQGDVLNADQLTAALPGHDVVASILGRRSTNGATLLSDGAVAMLKALQTSGVRRYIVVSQGLLFPSRNPLILLLRLILASAVV